MMSRDQSVGLDPVVRKHCSGGLHAVINSNKSCFSPHSASVAELDVESGEAVVYVQPLLMLW